MIILDCEQGSETWFSARAGIPTASGFSKIVTTKGAPSKQAEKYMLRLAGERILGKPEETFQSSAMQRGVELEEEAREYFEFTQGVEVQQVGLCYKDETRSVSCSPDGLLEESGLEIKCPLISTHIGYILKGKLPTDYFCQVQGSMYVTGFDSWWFLSYYPGLDPLLLKIERDPIFIGKLHGAIQKFNEELEATFNKINGRK